MDLLRLALAGLILLLLARIGRVAWRQRALAITIWRAIRPWHVGVGLALVTAVATVAGVLIAFVPGMALGLGRVVGLHGNAVFAPLEQGVAMAGPPPDSGPDWPLIVGASAFLLPLLAMLPWLAFVEEEIFRAGLERVSTGRLLRASLFFGLAHMVMLVPLGAALALAVAGLAYGVAYRHGYARAGRRPAPDVARRTYRPTRRAIAAAVAQREAQGAAPCDGGMPGHEAAAGDLPAATTLPVSPGQRQAAGVFHAAVLHTTCNSMLVLLIWISFVLAGLLA